MDHYITTGAVRVLTAPRFRRSNPENEGWCLIFPFLTALHLILRILNPLLSSKFKSFIDILPCYQSHKVFQNTPFPLNDLYIFFFLSHPANSQTADGKGAVNQAWRGPPRPTCLPSKWGRWIMCPFRLGSAGTETKRQGKWPWLNMELFLSPRAKRDATEDRAGASTPRSPGTPAPSTLLLPHTRLPPLGLR